MIEVAPITDEQKDGRVIYAYPDGNPISWNSVAMGWQKGESPDTDFNTGEFYVYKHEPTHYLPNGLPNPDTAVEGFESQAGLEFQRDIETVHSHFGPPSGTNYIVGERRRTVASLPEEVKEGEKLMIFRKVKA